ncbi:MAG: filamentous hemagglutinin N-terminal domain-containing protein [Chroococcales cyanobacterium]
MTRKNKPLAWVMLFGCWSGILSNSASAQLIPDNSLGTERSVITPQSGRDLIEGGALRQNNLFHSFREFNVENAQQVYFANPAGVENILTRVTGNNVSNIFGTLGVEGTANLFLLNPNGILFGENARLDLNGSFFASTAESLLFNNGVHFSTTNPEAPPLLTINVPVGLQFGENSGAIDVRGTGHSLVLSNPVSDVMGGAGASPTGLRVQPGHTLGLVGGNLSLEGGVLTAFGGRLELGSVQKGQVSLNLTPEGWRLGYEEAEGFGNVELRSRSLADASGPLRGSIAIQAENLTVEEGSAILIQNQGLQPGGAINIDAASSVTLRGISPDFSFISILVNETVAGNGGDVILTTPRLFVQKGAAIYTKNFSLGTGGNIFVDVSDEIRVEGPASFNNPSGIAAVNFNAGDGGNVIVSTGKLAIRNGGVISSTTTSTGNAGDITLQARESVELVGIDPIFSPSIITSSTLNAGNAGKVTLETQRLTIQDGGRVDSSTGASGNAGSVFINADEFIDIRGTVPGSVNPSLIISSANIVDPQLQFLLNLPPFPSGDSGNIILNTETLKVADGALINVRNDGSGNAGRLEITADSLYLEGGGITAATQAGIGGNINLKINELILMRNQAQISATAGGVGDGGNIGIESQFVIAFPNENSDIVANAFEGNGGNIFLTADSILGLQFRETQTPLSDITASSEFGLAGTVQITTPDVNPSQDLAKLPEEVMDSTPLVASTCAGNGGAIAQQQSQFVITGRGGLPPNPSDILTNEAIVADWITLNKSSSSIAHQPLETVSHLSQSQKQLTEAQGWIVNHNGNLVLTATPPTLQSQSSGQPFPSCQTSNF